MPDPSAPETTAPVSAPAAGPGTPAPEREFTVAERSQFQLVLRRFLQHRLAVASLVVLILLVLLAYVGGALWQYEPGEFTPDNSEPPSLNHPFGTDAAGKDQFAQVLRGTQISLQIAVLVALFSTLVGTVWGAVAGYFGGVTDTIMMRVSDLVLTLPLLAVADEVDGQGDQDDEQPREVEQPGPGGERRLRLADQNAE